MKETITISGRTYQIKDSLKSTGWKYEPKTKTWKKQAEIPQAFVGMPESEASREFVKTIQGNKKGCIVTAHNGCTVLFKSKEYVATYSPRTAAEAREDKKWHEINGLPTHSDLRDDHDYL